MTSKIRTSVHDVTQVKIERRIHDGFSVYALTVFDAKGDILELTMFTDNDNELRFDRVVSERVE